MNFSTNLQALRKQHKLTQEQLAEQLQVSRQAVTKWECGQSSPDLDRIAQICDLFGCDLTTLVQGTIQADNVPPQNHTSPQEDYPPQAPFDFDQFYADKQADEAFYHRHGLTIAGAVSAIIWGVALMIFLNMFELGGLGLVVLLLIVAVAVMFFIHAGTEREQFEKSSPLYSFYEEAECAAFQRRLGLNIGLGVAIIIIGLAAFMGLSMLDAESSIALALLLSSVAIGTGIFIYFGIQEERFKRVPAGNPLDTPAASKPKKEEDPISGMIMSAATVIFLVAGFVFHRWHPAWIVFPVGGVLCGIVENWHYSSHKKQD